MLLPADKFRSIIELTPLVSIDLVVKNAQGEYLLGLRTNRPAQNFWFVPGGRIQKGESLAVAFKRLTKQELGKELSIEQAKLLGPFDHFYDDCVFGCETSTHYIAIAYELIIDQPISPPNQQHSEYYWASINEIISRNDIHENVKAYFKKDTKH